MISLYFSENLYINGKNIEWYKLAIILYKYHTFISRVVNLSYFIYLHTTPLLMIKPILKILF